MPANAGPPGTGRPFRWALYHLLSFEALFAGMLYSNPLKLLAGITLPVDETVVLAGLSMMVGLLVVAREGIYVRGLIIVLAAMPLLLWITLSWSWSPSRMLAPRYLLYLWTVDLWCIAAGAMILAHSRERAVRFFIFMVLFSVVIAVVGSYIFVVYGTFKFYEGFEDAGRIYNRWGYAVTSGALVVFAIAVRSRALSLKQLLAGGVFALCMFFLLVASSRGSLLITAAACLVVVALGLPSFGRGRVDLPKAQLAAIGIIALGLLYVAVTLATGGHLDTLDRFSSLMEQADDPALVQGPNRFAYFAAAVRFWIASPVIGHGVGAFSNLFYGREVLGAQPHNIILELLADYGLVGLSLFLFMMAIALRRVSYGRLREDPILLCALLLFVSRLVGAMFNTELAAQQALFAFTGLLALRTASARSVTATAAPRRQSHRGLRWRRA